MSWIGAELQWKTNRKSCALMNDTSRNDLEWPWRSLLMFNIFLFPMP